MTLIAQIIYLFGLICILCLYVLVPLWLFRLNKRIKHIEDVVVKIQKDLEYFERTKSK
ncbi:MAG: hypothetical protein AB1556_16010 [Bacillota bacterium]